MPRLWLVSRGCHLALLHLKVAQPQALFPVGQAEMQKIGAQLSFLTEPTGKCQCRV